MILVPAKIAALGSVAGGLRLARYAFKAVRQLLNSLNQASDHPRLPSSYFPIAQKRGTPGLSGPGVPELISSIRQADRDIISSGDGRCADGRC